MVGQRVTAVRYFHVDDDDRYRVAPGASGPRHITDPAQRRRPAWRGDGFHWADHGIEFEASTGRVFSATPGSGEGIGLREMPMIPLRSGRTPVSPVGRQPRARPLAGVLDEVWSRAARDRRLAGRAWLPSNVMGRAWLPSACEGCGLRVMSRRVAR